MNAVGDGQVDVVLDPRTIMASASAQTGLDDYGYDEFADDLVRWVDAVEGEARLSVAGAVGFRASLQNNLVNRLRFHEDLKRHPEILEEDVSDPISIVGLPRTGTTKLLRLIACDRGVRHLPFWKLLNPARVPGAPGGGPDPRIAIADEHVAVLRDNFPELLAGHPFGTHEPDEEIFLMELVPDSWFNTTVRFHTPGYFAWWVDRPRDHVYGYLRQLLQYLQWQDGGRRGRPWVLKSPAHTASLDLLLSYFPRATIVQCHRNLTEAIPSTARIVEQMRLLLSDRVDPLELGPEVLSAFSGDLVRCVQCRKALGEDPRIVDVSYADLLVDARAAIKEVYAATGRPLSEETIRAMARWEVDNAQHRFGRHIYSLERYGYTESGIAEACGAYLARFGDLTSG
jgi:hypothetical protein